MQTGGPKALGGKNMGQSGMGFAGCGRHELTVHSIGVACIAAKWHATEGDSKEVAAWMGRQCTVNA
jgi:hypothetical protein